jgi:hypothetical protein
LKAKWAHFVKEELKNPSLCVYTQDLFQILENEMSVLLQQQVVSKFFASPQYNEFKASHVEPKSARVESTRYCAFHKFFKDALRLL